MIRLILPAVLLSMGVVLALAADDTPAPVDRLTNEINKSTAEMEDLQQQLQMFRDRMASLDEREKDFQRSYDEIGQEIDVTQKLFSELDQRERLLHEQSEGLQEELVATSRTHARRKAALSANLRAMYIRGRYSDLELILTSGSFSDYVTRARWETMLTRLGAGLVDQARAENRRVDSRRKQLNVALAEIYSNREEMSRQKENMADLRAEQLAVLRELDTERKGLKNRMLELSMNEQRLGYILADLEQQRQEKAVQTADEGGALSRLAGQLEWPVTGQVVRGFGRSVHPEFKTVTLNNGINIKASAGTAVAAVAVGKVEYADRLPGFGQCVILDHGVGYYTLYAHLDMVFVNQGEDISRGQVMGEVGRPSPGEVPQLYFEVRHGRTPLDPLNWLKSR